MGTQVVLGLTGLRVSTLCFGTGYLGGSAAAGARLLTRAYDLGVTFWDTSDDYGTHPHVARALREVGRDRVVVATKTYASTEGGARRSVTKALRELGVEAVDIFLLHAVDSALDAVSRESQVPAHELESWKRAVRRESESARVYSPVFLEHGTRGQATGEQRPPEPRPWTWQAPQNSGRTGAGS